jgi:hypothetical protein
LERPRAAGRNTQVAIKIYNVQILKIVSRHDLFKYGRYAAIAEQSGGYGNVGVCQYPNHNGRQPEWAWYKGEYSSTDTRSQSRACASIAIRPTEELLKRSGI